MSPIALSRRYVPGICTPSLSVGSLAVLALLTGACVAQSPALLGSEAPFDAGDPIEGELVIDESWPGDLVLGPSARVSIVQGGKIQGGVRSNAGRPGSTSRAELELAGGEIRGDVDVAACNLTVRTGIIAGGVAVYEGAVRIYGGRVGDLETVFSNVDVHGGTIAGPAQVGSGRLRIFGGTLSSGFAVESGTVEVFGGAIAESSTVEGRGLFAGGVVQGEIFVIHGFATLRGGESRGVRLVESRLTVRGTDLAHDGAVLTGKLEDGRELGDGVAVVFESGECEVILEEEHERARAVLSVALPRERTCDETPPVEVRARCECAISAFRFGIAHDANALAVSAVEPSPFVAGLNGGAGPELWLVDDAANASACPHVSGGVIVDVVSSSDPAGAVPIPASDDVTLARIDYQSLAGPEGDRVGFVELVDCLRNSEGAPAPSSVRCADGEVDVEKGPGVLLEKGTCFRRADSNSDGIIDLSDPISTLLWLFRRDALAHPLACLDAADSNDDGRLDISDPLHTLGALFDAGSAPDFSSTCRPDERADSLDCALPGPCS